METFFNRLHLTLRTPSWRRTILARQALATALLVLALGSFILQQLGPQSTRVVITRPVDPGGVLTAEDLGYSSTSDTAEIADAISSIDDAIGKVVALPLRPGDIVHSRALVGAELSTALGNPEHTLVPITLADPTAAEFAITGTTVTVLTADDSGGNVVAEGAKVVLGTSRSSDSTEPGTVLLALDKTAAQNVAIAALRRPLTIIITP